MEKLRSYKFELKTKFGKIINGILTGTISNYIRVIDKDGEKNPHSIRIAEQNSNIERHAIML